MTRLRSIAVTLLALLLLGGMAALYHHFRRPQGFPLDKTPLAEEPRWQRAERALDVQATSGSIAGRVMDGTGRPLAGAWVAALVESESTPRLLQTGADGAFELSDLGPGKYIVSASAAGF